MIALLTVAVLAQYTPQEAQALFAEANDAYYRGEFEQAQKRYEKLLDAGLGGPDVLFNLGTTHLAANQLGPAVLYLERAAALADDEDVAANLSAARERQVDQVIGAETSVPFTHRLAAAMDERLVAIAFLTTWGLAFVLLWLTVWRGPGRRLVLGLITSAVFLGAMVLGAGVAIHHVVNRTVEEAIVFSEAAKVREFPGETAKVAFEVHAGLKVRIMERAGEYVRIRLPNALEGWTERGAVVSL